MNDNERRSGADDLPFVAAKQDDFAGAIASRSEVSGVHNGRGRAAADRFRVYKNNVIVSLRDALRTTFTATERLMGEEFFGAAAIAFAERNRPQSPLLFRYGEGFAAFLGTLPGLAEYPFVPEVARIEHARVQAYHAADAPPLAPDILSKVAPEALGETRFSPHPASALLWVPKGGLAAFQANQSPPLPETPAPAALITRPQFDVVVTGLPAPTAQFAEKLMAGAPLAQAAEVDDLDLAQGLGLLLGAGAFTGLVDLSAR
ncbi:MAG: DNA-binding domain-containing protein [Pseudomonadota bacterium]